MTIDPQLVAAVIEGAIPLIAGGVFTARLVSRMRTRERGGVLWIGPGLLLFGVLLSLQPILRGSSLPQLPLKQETPFSGDVSDLSYSDFLGTWEAVVEGQAIRRRLSYRFDFRPDGDCVLDYTSFNLDTSAEVKHRYDMRCEVSDGSLMHTAKDPGAGEQYDETHTIQSFDGVSFVWSDNFVGPIKYTKRG